MPLQPGGSQVYVSRPLTTISVAYQNGPLSQNFIAAQAFPTVPVQRQGDLYWKYKKGDWFRGQAAKRAPGTESAGGGFNVETASYFTEVYAVHQDVADQDRANAVGNFDLDRDAAEWCTQQLLLKREKDWTTSFLSAGVWTGSTAVNGGVAGGSVVGATATGAGAGAGNVVFWNRSGSDPIGDVRKQSFGMAEKTGYRPNTLVIGPHVMAALLDNASVIERIKYSERAVVGTDLLATLFEVDRVLVTWGIQNTANEGAAADVFSFVGQGAGKDALLCYSAPRPGLKQPTAGYIFTWAGFLGAASLGSRVKRFRMEAIESDRIEAEMAYDMRVIAADLGVFFDGIVE